MTKVTSPKPQIKEEEEFKTGEQPKEKCGWGPCHPFCKSQEQKEEQGKMKPQKVITLSKAASHKTKNIKFKHDQGQAAMGIRDGKVKF